MASIIERIRRKARKAVREFAIKQTHKHVDNAKVDPRIRYPSYKSFDDIIDVERLKALNRYVTERVERHAKNLDDERFTTGPLTISSEAPRSRGRGSST